MNVISPINHSNYNKITDDIYMLGANFLLKMNVSLYYNIESKGKSSYHKEYEYFDQQSNSNMISIKRTFDYYLSIESIKNNYGLKTFIRIGVSEILLLRQHLNKAVRWFTDLEFKDLFIASNGKLRVGQKILPLVVEQLPMNKYLALEPTVVEYNDKPNVGVRMYLSEIDVFIDMALPKFMGFVQIINDINLFMCAQIMLNYIGRPEYGSNLYSFAQQPQIQEPLQIEANDKAEKRKKKKHEVSIRNKFD